MTTATHQFLTAACRDILVDLTQRRSEQTPDLTCPIPSVITEEELSSRIRTIVEKVQADYSKESDIKRRMDALKGHFEVAGRELILDVAESEIAVNTSDRNAKWLLIAKLYDACDIIRILFTLASTTFIPVAESSTSKSPPKWDPVVMFMSIIDELVELLSIDSWNVFLGYFESRQEELTGGKLLAGVRALYFLKPLNSLLRITARSSYAHPSTTFATFEEYLESGAQSNGQSSASGSASELELRGRIHILMSGLFKLSDQSATNSRGAYADMLFGYDEITGESTKPLEGEVETTEDSEMELSDNIESGQSSELYDAVCALQRFFSNPAGITTPAAGENSQTGLEEFKRVTGILLSAFSRREVRPVRDASIPSNVFMPRYIPSRDAVEFQLGELEFRRQLCVQLLIILQQVQNLHVKDKSRHPKDLHFPAVFSVETEDYEWARRQAATVHGDIAKMPGGRDFDNLVSNILSRERNHALWKHIGCVAFEREPISDAAAEEEIQKAEARRQAIIAPLPPFAHPAGTKALSRLSRNPLTSVEQLKNRKVEETVKSLQDKWNTVDFDEGMGGTPREFLEQKASLSWRALRLVLEDDFDIFEKLKDKYDPNEVVKVKEEMSKTTAETAQPTHSTTGTPNPPTTATFAPESDNDAKDIKPEVDESMPGPDADTPMQSGIDSADPEKPLVDETASMDTPDVPAENGTPAAVPDTLNDVDMK